MVATVMDGIGNRFEFLCDFFSSNPVFRIIRKFVINIEAGTITFYKVSITAAII